MAVVLSANIDCPVCGTTFEGVWRPVADTIQDLDEAPVQSQVCPDGHEFDAEYPGWISYTEAG